MFMNVRMRENIFGFVIDMFRNF